MELGDLVQALASVPDAIWGSSPPVWLAYVQAAATVLVMFFTAVAAIVAARSAGAARVAADSARESIDYQRVRDILVDFDQQDYFMRFWRLDQMSRGHDFGTLDRNFGRHSSKNRGPTELEQNREDIWLDALAGNWDTFRADMFTLYNFAMRLNSWLCRDASRKFSADDVAFVNDLFGPHLTGTFLNHRVFACRLEPPDGKSADYYLRHYGLADGRYTHLVQTLLDDLVARERMYAGQEEAFVRINSEVSEHLGQVGC